MDKNSNFTGSSTLQELRERLFFVFFGVLVFRLGVCVPIPYVDVAGVTAFIKLQIEYNGLFSMFNMFSGGALTKFSIFALGVIPYITSSIVIQITTTISSHLSTLKKDGRSGQRKITQYTRYLTLVLSLCQSCIISTYVFNQPGLVVTGVTYLSFCFLTMMTMSAGSMFLMWLGEQLTERGIGNGISLLIFTGIMTNLPFEITSTIMHANQGVFSYFSVWLLFFLLAFVIIFVVFVERAQRRVSVHYAKRQHGRKMYAPQQSFLPLKLNMAGVIPPIFASSVLMVPGLLFNWFSWLHLDILTSFSKLLQPGSFLYIVVFSLTIIFFCHFYTGILFNAKDMSDNLKKSGAFIIGVRPGLQTANYISSIVTRLTSVGALYITVICLLPVLLLNFFGYGFVFTFGGTSLLIVVVVIIDFISQIQSYLMSQRYDMLLKKSHLSY